VTSGDVTLAEPSAAAVQRVAGAVLGDNVDLVVTRVAEGVSTYVYRVRRGPETFYLRVLPEAGATFAPEVLALDQLRQRGVRAPRVLYYEACDESLERSVMVTTEIAGDQIGRRPLGRATQGVLIEAGRDLATINSLPVSGFGWVKRDMPVCERLDGEHSTLMEFALEHLDSDLATLAATVLTRSDTAAIRAVVEDHRLWLASPAATLAHGDFDLSQIYQHDGCYSGIIDFGEIRGTDPWYDLGHFAMQHGEASTGSVLAWLLDGYRSVTPLPPDHRLRIAFASLLIAVRALSRCIERRPSQVAAHPGLASIPRDLRLLRGAPAC
jgi:aminoglycoside phosphotransferase (APT) family kinase protein